MSLSKITTLLRNSAKRAAIPALPVMQSRKYNYGFDDDSADYNEAKPKTGWIDDDNCYNEAKSPIDSQYF